MAIKNKLSIETLLKRLHAHYPRAQTTLHWKTPLQLLVATMLSAQCTDVRVNKVTPALFKRYPDAKAFAHADLKTLEELIYTTGFYKSKAEHIKSACLIIHEKYRGQVPDKLSLLVQLPGVGRKTANVVLGTAFGIASGIAVDTHVQRTSRRLGLTAASTPEKIEQALMKLVPKKEWVFFSHALILHGRALCKAKQPQCEQCFLKDGCPSAFKA